MSTFFNWLWLRGDVSANPVVALKRARRRSEEPKWVTAEDVVALLSACRNDGERAILATHVRAALRYTELTELRLSDIELLRDEMHVLGKGRVRRSVPILSDLHQTLAERADLGRVVRDAVQEALVQLGIASSLPSTDSDTQEA